MNILAELKVYAPYVFPPLIGAVIGYITNYLAVRMLFRPLHAWHLFGLRVPLTPGIFPAKRAQIATRMGQTVGKRLITREAVAQAMEKPKCRKALRGAVHDRLSRFLEKDLGPASSLIPPGYERRFDEILNQAEGSFCDTIFRYIDADDFPMRVDRFLQENMDEVLAGMLGAPSGKDPSSTPIQERLRNFVEEYVLGSEELERQVSACLDAVFSSARSSDKEICSLLPATAHQSICRLIEREVPPALEMFVEKLQQPELQERWRGGIKSLMKNYVSSRRGITGSVIRILVEDKIDRESSEFNEKLRQELTNMLRDHETQAEVVEVVQQEVDRLLQKPFYELFANLAEEDVQQLKSAAKQKVFSLLHDPETLNTVTRALEKGILRAEQENADLEKEEPATGQDTMYCGVLVQGVINALRDPDLRGFLRNKWQGTINHWIYNRPLGRLDNRIPEDLRSELEEFLHEQVLQILAKEIPVLIETIDIQELVEEKVNALPISEVEIGRAHV